jgi:WD40 repeat protein
MLVEKGELFSLRFEDNSSKIEHSFSIQHALDSETHSLNQVPTSLAFMDLPDIKFDSEITENTLTRKDSSLGSSRSVSKEFKLITIGCSRGSIVILSLDEIDKIRARLTYHREMILSMQIIKGDHGYTLASVCAENYLRLTSLEKSQASCFFAVYFGDNLSFIRSFEDKLAIVFKKGIFEMARAVGPEECQVVQNLDAVDHEGEIYSLDVEPTRRLLMTAGSDNRIKIWSMLKILIFEIKLDEGLKYGIWSNNLEIFVAHRNKLLYLKDFAFDTEDI